MAQTVFARKGLTGRLSDHAGLSGSSITTGLFLVPYRVAEGDQCVTA